MPYEDLREFIGALEKNGELIHVTEKVHWSYELAGWCRKTTDMGSNGPALLFENIEDYQEGYRVFTNGIGTYSKIAIALDLDPGTSPKEIIDVYASRLKNPIQPIIVSEGKVKENIHTGDDINLLEFPVPWWTPRDGGRYIGTWMGLVSKDPKTNIANAGLYRVMITDEKNAAIGFLPNSDMAAHYSECERQNKPLEVAMVIGADETFVMAASTGFPLDVDEYAMAGALRNKAIELVKCETVDLEVPANAEIVVEGLVLPHERCLEGPFGEHPGYHGGDVRMRPIFHVTAITHRNNPILRGSLLGKPVCENHLLRNLVISGEALRMFHTNGPTGVVGINCPPEGDSVLSCVISMKPRFVGHSRSVGRIMISSVIDRLLKYVVIVDDDIDPFDLGQVWWAIITRTQGSRDIEVLRYGSASRSDPSVPKEHGEYTDKVIIDATKKLDYPYNERWGGHWAPVGLPPKEASIIADLKWRRMVDKEENLDSEIEKATYNLKEEVFPKWSKWREKYYKLSEEEQKREMSLSYPVTSSSDD